MASSTADICAMGSALTAARRRLDQARRDRERALAALEAARTRLDEAAGIERGAQAEIDRLEREESQRIAAEAARVAAAAERSRAAATRAAANRAKAPAKPDPVRATTAPPPLGRSAPRPAVAAPVAAKSTPPAPKPRDREALARALAVSAGLVPTAVVAQYGKARRTVELEPGATYRVEPLNPRRRKERGRVGRLTSWDDQAKTGTMAWSDGGAGPVTLADLVREG